jgi:membrane protein implicated in regulation of membrane protease activity
MTVLFLASFIGGLLLAVGVMLFGVERPARAGGGSVLSGAAPGRPRVRASVPVLAGFLIVFGVLGYLVVRIGNPGAWQPGGIALAGGVGAALLTRWIVAKSAAIVPEFDIDDERYVLQGHIARVVAPIASGDEGKISFQLGTGTRMLRARGVDDTALAAGTEVVIERIEGEVAFVEPWVQVEERL